MIKDSSKALNKALNNRSDTRFTIVGLKREFFSDLYHSFLMKSWFKTLSIIIILFLIINFFFAILYSKCGDINNAKSFYDYFFFSIQTLSTIGYGFMYPTRVCSHILVATQSFLGLLFISFLTGLVFAKFSLPKAKVLFTKNALVCYDEDNLAFQLRLANQRSSNLVDAQIKVALLKLEPKKDGSMFRKIYDLKLVRDQIPIFSLTFLAQHIIDETSPFYGETHQSFVEKEAFVIITITGLDETISQTVHARYIYTFEEIIWGGKFKDVICKDQKGKTYIDYNNFDIVES